MAFHLEPDETVGHGLRRLARKQLKSADAALQSRRTPADRSVYDARRGLKKTQAILEILQEDDGRGIGGARKRLRKASRALARSRDADAIIELFDRVRQRAGRSVSARTLALVRRQLVADKRALSGDRVIAREIRHAERLIRKSRRSVDRWKPKHARFAALGAAIAAGLRAGRKAMNTARIRGRSTDFHEWRKAVKLLWYELRLLESCGRRVRADVRTLDRIETWLGEDHNAVVMCERVFGDAALVAACRDLEALRRVVDLYQAALRRKALARGTRIYAHDPASYVTAVKRLWREWTQAALP